MLYNEPKEFQITGIEKMLSSPYFINGDDMGLGKTFQAIAVSTLLDLPTLVIAPAYLKENWKSEFMNHARVDASIDPKTPRRHTIVSHGSKFLTPEYWRPFPLVIVDEAHYLKEIKAKRTQKVYNLCRRFPPKYLQFLTGTPLKNRVSEWYTILSFIMGNAFLKKFPNVYAFCNTFCYREIVRIKVKGKRGAKPSYRDIVKYYGIKNEVELKKLIAPYIIRRRADKVLGLAPRQIIPVRVPVKEDLFLKEEFKNKSTNSKTKRLNALEKVPHTVEHAVTIHETTGKPVVVYSDHPEPVIMIGDRLAKLGYRVRVGHGKVSPEDRFTYANEFQSGELDFIILTIGAASTGLNLTYSNQMLFNDMSWVQEDNEQAMGRIRRIGQEEKVCFYHFMLSGYVDQDLVDKCKTKMKDTHHVNTLGVDK